MNCRAYYSICQGGFQWANVFHRRTTLVSLIKEIDRQLTERQCQPCVETMLDKIVVLSSTMTIFVRRREIISRALIQSIHFHFYQKNDEAFPPVSCASQSTKNQIIEPIKSRVSSVQSDQNCDELLIQYRLLLLHW